MMDEANMEEEENELAKAVYHYDTLIEELKKSHASEIELMRHKLDKTSQSLEEKQQELFELRSTSEQAASETLVVCAV